VEIHPCLRNGQSIRMQNTEKVTLKWHRTVFHKIQALHFWNLICVTKTVTRTEVGTKSIHLGRDCNK